MAIKESGLNLELNGSKVQIKISEMTMRSMWNIATSISKIDLKEKKSNFEAAEEFFDLIKDKIFSDGKDNKARFPISGISPGEIFDLAPSELWEIWEKFRQVNDRFFLICEKVGATKILQKIFKGILKIGEDFIDQELQNFMDQEIEKTEAVKEDLQKVSPQESLSKESLSGEEMENITSQMIPDSKNSKQLAKS